MKNRTPRDLLYSVTEKDFEVQWFSGTGAGGQHRNKHQNCVRLHHRDSGARATGQSHKERRANRDEAFFGIVNSVKFKMWQYQKLEEIRTGQTIKQRVEKTMSPGNLKIEFRDMAGKWQTEMAGESD